MRLELVDQRPHPAEPPLPELQLAELVARLGHPDWTVNLVLVEDHVMADLNARWYGGEGPTDVLSFSYLENEGPVPENDGPALENDGPAAGHLAAGHGEAAHALWVAAGEQETDVTAGEVIVAPAFVSDRCRREGWDLATEWALLMVHGTLHILGWEHGSDEARHAMRACEAEVLSREGFEHPLPALESED